VTDNTTKEEVDRFVPPVELMFDGTTTAEDYRAIGVGFTREYIINRGRLEPQERVLDLGCGIGQKARVLKDWLNANGSYEGLDIVPTGIEWCRAAYAEIPNFRFTLEDRLHSSHYNPSGQVHARDYTLPYKDEDFDMVFLASVFTHLLPDEFARYISEISRVLKPNGRCVASAFLMNASTKEQVRENKAHIPFVEIDNRYWVWDRENPSKAVGLSEFFCRSTMRANRLIPCEISYGFWSGQPDLLRAYQDCIIAVKAPSEAI
jgi:SAM-dependent methyltransferase